MPIIYPQNVTVFQTDDSYYAHQVDYGYDGLELFNDFPMVYAQVISNCCSEKNMGTIAQKDGMQSQD